MRRYTFSICIPTYNGAAYISDTLHSIFRQTYTRFEVLISDDCSTDDTEQVIRRFNDSRIRYFRTDRNVGYGDNLKTFRKRVSGDIMFMMAQDDLLSRDALDKVCRAYNRDDEIGAVIRPYYQFDLHPDVPVRYAPPLDRTTDRVVSLSFDKTVLARIIEASGLLSALSYKVTYMDVDFHSHVFPSHAYPFFSIFKKHPIVFLHDYIVAVRIFSSQARFKSSIYEPSPCVSWIQMFETIFPEKKYSRVRENCIDYVARNYVGLVQIKNYGSFKKLTREISVLISYRRRNLLHPTFWFYCLICLFLPRFLLVRIVDAYKNTVLSRIIRSHISVPSRL